MKLRVDKHTHQHKHTESWTDVYELWSNKLWLTPSNNRFDDCSGAYKHTRCTHPHPCHLWPVRCSAAPSMLCRTSAGRAAPAESLYVRPVDRRHTGGSEGPEREIKISTFLKHWEHAVLLNGHKVFTSLKRAANHLFWKTHFKREWLPGWTIGTAYYHKSL